MSTGIARKFGLPMATLTTNKRISLSFRSVGSSIVEMSRDLIREYLSYCRVEKGLAANSIESYANDLGRVRTWADKCGLDLATLSRRDLREWLIDLGGEKLSENSKRRMLS